MAVGLQAAPIAPGQWLLQVTANDLSTFEVGPDTYAHWFDGGYVSYLIFTAVPQHIIESWTLIPCPLTTPCDLVSTPAPHSHDGSAPNAAPEPETWALVASGLILLAAVARRRDI